MSTGFIYHDIFLKHDPGAGHPESKERLIETRKYLGLQPWFADLQQLTIREYGQQWLEHIHTQKYINHARDACLAGDAYLDSMDVGISRDSFDAALYAVYTALTLTDAVIDGTIDNGFALLRPPGHHAEKEMALGFCLFNNVAIAARYLQIRHGIGRVLILDWDVHHGNGTQHSFEEDPSVLYISTHQYPFYPGTGAHTETGIGRGLGSILNCPMAAGSTDNDYEKVFMEKILPKIDLFKPEFILVSAGFDAHRDDPLGQINLSTEFFGWMTRRLMEKADKHCNGRLVSLLEGGYNLHTLPLCIAEHLLQLSDTGVR